MSFLQFQILGLQALSISFPILNGDVSGTVWHSVLNLPTFGRSLFRTRVHLLVIMRPA